MRYSPRNIEIAFGHAGLTHYGGILFFNEFSRMLQLRRFLTRHLRYPRRNHDYKLSQMILALVYPIILGLDRLETASHLRSNGTFQYLTGLASYPSPQSLRRFLLRLHSIFGNNSTGSMTTCCSTSFTGRIIGRD
jgi:Transposase DDE domain group 1